MPGAQETQGAPVIDLGARRQDRDRRQALGTAATAREDSPGWLLRSPAYRVVDNLVPWAGLADGGSFAALLGDPIDAHLIRTTFPPRALARSFCGGPTLEEVTYAITREPRRIKARVWVGGYGTPDEGISVAAVYVRFEGDRADADARAGRHPALWEWLADRLGQDVPDGLGRSRTRSPWTAWTCASPALGGACGGARRARRTSGAAGCASAPRAGS